MKLVRKEDTDIQKDKMRWKQNVHQLTYVNMNEQSLTERFKFVKNNPNLCLYVFQHFADYHRNRLTILN